PHRGWYVASLDTTGDLWISLHGTETYMRSSKISGVRGAHELLLSAAPLGELVVMHRRRPQVLAAISWELTSEVARSVNLSVESDSTSFLDPLWFVVGIAHLGNEQLITIADLRSEVRRFVVVHPTFGTV